MNTVVLSTALGVLFTAAACGRAQPPGESEGGDAPQSADAPGIGTADTAAVPSGAVPTTCEDLHDTILAAPPTRQAFSAAFGAPDSVTAYTEPNRHVPGATDSLFTVYYPGLVMDIRTPQNARDMATHVRVEDNRYLAFPGIGMGTSEDRLEEVLGNPTERETQALIWDCAEAVEQPVTFHLANGRVSAITIAYYVD